ncbi:aspartate/glutamate racemase family protein [Roseomonas sp. PWR1]|uniref:Aspartate/glutamate racemase family protein n=1 Tax=Roseomonas nitratireducens TaxID=2820810 RepID=A0ABS4B1D3_9PROT|nr:aspartate/glutamate racemase family protein [Neoroseomonas nitratireducens]MBP0466662.1 aspartate/glutamate racemase family protein [Neoroseomonas nitratireducens]
MRILVINSNTTDSVTDRIGAAARAVASPGTEIEAVSAPFGLPLIVTRADWLVAGPATLAALAARRGTYDAAVIACFGDPGLDAAKELVDVPVLGISEAAFHAACMLGRRFGVVSFTAALRPMFEECLAHHGLTARCAGFRMGPPFAGDPGRVAEERLDLLAALCAESAEQDGAEAIILAGGPLAGIAPLLQPRVAVPLLDGTQAAVRLAEAMAGLMPRSPRPRRARALTGFAEDVASLYGRA